METGKKEGVKRLVICDNSLNFDMICPFLFESFGYPDDFLENKEFDFILGICYDENADKWILVQDSDLITERCTIILMGDEFSNRDVIGKIAGEPDTGLLYHSATMDYIIDQFGHNAAKKSSNDSLGLYLPVLQLISKDDLGDEDIRIVLSMFDNW